MSNWAFSLALLLWCGVAVADDYTFTLDWVHDSKGGPAPNGTNIYRDGKLIQKVAANVSSYKDPVTAPAGQNICYEVEAVTVSAVWPKSNKACMAMPVKPPTPTAKPSTPTGLTVTIESASAIRMSWQNNSSNEASLELRRKTGKAPPATKNITGIPAGTAAYTDEGLPVSTTYCYQVRATNSLGSSSYSNQSCGTTLAK